MTLPFVISFANFLARVQFLMCASVAKTCSSFFFVWYGDNTIHEPTYHITSTTYRGAMYYIPHQYCCLCSLRLVPDRTRTTKKGTALESSYRHYHPARSASARGARGHCFDRKRAGTAPGCGACSTSRQHRGGSVLIVCLLYTSPSPRD